MTQASILIVEDDKVTAMLISEILCDSGYRVSGVVDSGEDAISFVHGACPDLILMDIYLKGSIDGIATFDKIKTSRNVPVIFISGSIDAENIARSVSMKPSGYLHKPITKERLIRKVEMALAGHRL